MKKGFTLIELLAVIVILAIIALISVPIIKGVIDKVQKGAVEDSVYGIQSSAELYYMQDTKNHKVGLYVLDGTNIQYKNKVDKGYVYYHEDGKISIIIYEGKHCGYKYKDKKAEVGIIKNNMCVLTDDEVDESTFAREAQYQIARKDYEIGESITWAGLDWYVVSDSGKQVTLELKENYDIGAYSEESTTYEGSIAYTKLNTDFVNSNEILQSAILEGTVISQGTYNNEKYYVRIPNLDELSSALPNDSSTAFWTMTADESNIYLGNSDGSILKTYLSNGTSSYRSSYSVSCDYPYTTNIPITSYISSIERNNISILPTMEKVTYNTYSVETIIGGTTTAYTGHGTYTFKYCSGTSIQTGTTYCWTEYATNCTNRESYSLINNQTNIGYRPVITVQEN